MTKRLLVLLGVCAAAAFFVLLALGHGLPALTHAG